MNETQEKPAAQARGTQTHMDEADAREFLGAGQRIEAIRDDLGAARHQVRAAEQALEQAVRERMVLVAKLNAKYGEESWSVDPQTLAITRGTAEAMPPAAPPNRAARRRAKKAR